MKTQQFLRAAMALAVMCMLANAGAQEVPSGSPPLTLNEALARFRTHGFDLIIADASIASAQGDLTIAGATANPSLSLSRGSSSTYDPSLCSGCSNVAYSSSVTDQAALSDLLSGKKRLRIAVARAALDVAKRSRADVERTLEFAVKQQFTQAALSKAALLYAHEAQRLAEGTLSLVETRYRAGAVSEADVARAEVQKLEADQAVDSAQQTLDSAKAGLAYLLGYGDVPRDFDVADELTRSGGTDLLRNATREAMLQEALAHRPDLAASRMQITRSEAALELAKRQRIPDFFPSAQYSREGQGQSAIQPPTLTFGISATVPIFYHQRGEIAKAGADLKTQQIAARKVEAQVGSDVSTAFAAFTSARNRTGRMEGRLLERAKLARDLVRLQYEKGAASLLEALDASRTLIATQNEYLQNLNDYWTAVFQLEQATGVELRQ
jgi:cobalt-zinc-cadmium efflux system outer membrane protein